MYCYHRNVPDSMYYDERLVLHLLMRKSAPFFRSADRFAVRIPDFRVKPFCKTGPKNTVFMKTC